MAIEEFNREKALAWFNEEQTRVVLFRFREPIRWFSAVHEYELEARGATLMQLLYLTDNHPSHSTEGAEPVEVVGVDEGDYDPDEFLPDQPKEEPFRITGTGRYRSRDGNTYKVAKSPLSNLPWEYRKPWQDDSGLPMTWHDSGSYALHDGSFESPNDLIARLPDEPDLPLKIDQLSAEAERDIEKLKALQHLAECVRALDGRLTALEQSKNGEK